MSESIRLLPHTFYVSALASQLDASQAWNRYNPRRAQYVHQRIDDIWARYNAWENFDGDLARFNEPHESVWYPEIADIPALKPIVFDVMRAVEGERLGGVLITRIPSGSGVAPHADGGWHASYYGKFAVQVKGNADQAFCFRDARLSALPGELYTFDNSRVHWVTNDSDSERITLIICIRGAKYAL